jgi:mannose-1-phosphate guanylyltransferase
MIAVILAGGQGTRLWPMSRKEKPKQFFEIIGENPMIVDVFLRLRNKFSVDDIYISTQENFAAQIRQLLPEIPQKNILIEPLKRDTAPAKAYVVNALIQEGRGKESVAFIPTDHFIANEELFLKSLEVADKLIQETGKMLDIAVVPSEPSTALGYTQIGARYKDVDGIQVFHFKGHKEKPDYQKAKEYIASGQYLWHANYYMWTPEKFFAAFKQYAPEIAELIEKMNAASSQEEKKKIFAEMPKISVDYAITEKMDPEDVLIIRADFGWSDIGTWNVLYHRLKENDQQGNVVKGEVVEVDSHNNLVYGEKDKMIAMIGLNDMIVVDTNDALLICPKGRSEDLKQVIRKLEDSNNQAYL